MSKESILFNMVKNRVNSDILSIEGYIRENARINHDTFNIMVETGLDLLSQEGIEFTLTEESFLYLGQGKRTY